MSSDDVAESVVKNDRATSMPFDRYENYSANVSSQNLTALFQHLEGKILTFVDASYPDSIQRNAIKSLLKRALWEDYDILQEWFYNQQNGYASIFPF